jgi:lipoyl(octanoyl) transferase
MIEYLYLGRVDYDQGLRLQEEIAAQVFAGKLQNVLLLLEHPPVLTLGRNANRAHVLAGDELLAVRGISLRQINRGGDVTYHGPGQLVGYPLFNLRSLKNSSGGRMGPVDIVRGMEEVLIRVCMGIGVRAARLPGLTGVWCGSESPINHSATPASKIAAIGIHVARGITSHGFAFNLTTDLRDFDLIVPCGIRDHAVTSLQREVSRLPGCTAPSIPALEVIAHQVARQFGTVFNQHVLAIESLDDLRQLAAREFPAQDTPLRTPADLERAVGKPLAPVQA